MRNCKAPHAWRVPEEPAAVPVGGGVWPGFETTREPHISDQAPPMWRAPEGPEGTGGPLTATSPARLE